MARRRKADVVEEVSVEAPAVEETPAAPSVEERSDAPKTVVINAIELLVKTY